MSILQGSFIIMICEYYNDVEIILNILFYI